MINWFLQLNNSQLGNSFNSFLEKHLVLSFPSQSNPNPIQSVIERGNLRTQNVFLWRKEKRPVHKRRGVRTPTTSPPLSQVMSPTTWSSTSSAIPRGSCSSMIPSSDQDVENATLSKLHTEDEPITAQSVVVVCCV